MRKTIIWFVCVLAPFPLCMLMDTAHSPALRIGLGAIVILSCCVAPWLRFQMLGKLVLKPVEKAVLMAPTLLLQVAGIFLGLCRGNAEMALIGQLLSTLSFACSVMSIRITANAGRR